MLGCGQQVADDSATITDVDGNGGDETLGETSDCEEDLQCFIDSIDDENLAKVDHTITIDILGMKQTTTTYMEVKNYDEDDVDFYVRHESSSAEYPEGTPQQVIDGSKAVYDAMKGNDGSCIFEKSDLIDMLNAWNEGSISTDDWSVADCEGDYFEMQEITTDDADEEDETNDTTEDDDESGDNESDDEVIEEIDIDDESGSAEIIEIEDLQFKPEDMTIDVGTKIKWVHNDKFADSDKIKHIIRVYKVGEAFDLQSDALFYGDSFEYTFDEPGTYRYISIVYAARGAEGNLVVE